MFDAVLDVLFPVVFLSLPTLAAIYLAGFVFGKAETVAAVKVVGVVFVKAVLNIGRRFQRAAIAFVSDDDGLAPFTADELHAIHKLFDMTEKRLDEIDSRLADVEGRIIDADVEASTPF